MKKLFVSLLTAGALFGVTAVSSAQVLFTYTAATTFTSTGTAVYTQSPFTLTANPANDVSPDNAAFPGTDIVVGSFQVVTSDPNAATQHISQGFSVLLTITHAVLGGGSGSVTLTGTIDFDVNGSQTNNTVGVFTNLPQVVVIDGIPFTVGTPTSFTNVSAPAGPPASYSVHVSAPQGTRDVPEPGSVAMLMCSGVGASLVVIRRRRK